ncbi:MAG: DUF4405 domain-containing protein, partial [Myxococcales bacterium]|nr:DUF4405 domain-containing protein [Myxococcales bacterium]
MKLRREWVTPLTGGAFLLVAVTGVLMFFHVDRGLNKVAHEWLGWVLVAAVALHVVTNARALGKHLKTRRGQALVAVFVVLLGASFYSPPREGDGGPPFVAPVAALAGAPMATLAEVAGLSEDEVRARLRNAGFDGDAPNVTAAVGREPRM